MDDRVLIPTPAEGRRLVWLDVETTGLDPYLDQILEVGVITTDTDLVVIDRRSWVVSFKGKISNPVVHEMHSKNGLLQACAKSKHRLKHVAEDLKQWFGGPFSRSPQNNLLAGSSIGFDKSFFAAKEELRPILDLFHYRVVDVSTVKELVQAWRPEIAAFRPKDRKRHRVLPDLEDSINELRYYRATVFR